jgi:hypothetical protein
MNASGFACLRLPGLGAPPEFNATDNQRLVGVAIPTGRVMPRSGWPLVVYFDGAQGGGSGQPQALLDPSYCNKHVASTMASTTACGLNFTSTPYRQCQSNADGKGYTLGAAGGTYWKHYPYQTLEYASDYTSNRLFRRLLQQGFAVVMPQVRH